jgi:hypothetical protein
MNWFKKIAGMTPTLMLLAVPTFLVTAAWGEAISRNTGSMVIASETTNDMDRNLARQIGQAWAEDKDARGAVAFQENGEIALSQGNEQQARHYFEEAEQELAHLKPSPASDPLSAE